MPFLFEAIFFPHSLPSGLVYLHFLSQVWINSNGVVAVPDRGWECVVVGCAVMYGVFIQQVFHPAAPRQLFRHVALILCHYDHNCLCSWGLHRTVC